MIDPLTFIDLFRKEQSNDWSSFFKIFEEREEALPPNPRLYRDEIIRLLSLYFQESHVERQSSYLWQNPLPGINFLMYVVIPRMTQGKYFKRAIKTRHLWLAFFFYGKYLAGNFVQQPFCQRKTNVEACLSRLLGQRPCRICGERSEGSGWCRWCHEVALISSIIPDGVARLYHALAEDTHVSGYFRSRRNCLLGLDGPFEGMNLLGQPYRSACGEPIFYLLPDYGEYTSKPMCSICGTGSDRCHRCGLLIEELSKMPDRFLATLSYLAYTLHHQPIRSLIHTILRQGGAKPPKADKAWSSIFSPVEMEEMDIPSSDEEDG
ncbi:MAG: hypothetical protein QNK37_08540 [Acidobacteriota bacterium]|nr:hypothetical protein [Acidobacteriota bacterium]